VGRISYEKNCDIVLNAFAIILKNIDATLDIIGDGPALNSLKAQAKDLHLENKVHFPGFIPHSALPGVYRNYDLFLTASTMETQGLVVLEAMAGGLPCIGVRSFALPELIHDGKNGFICDPYNHIEIAEKAILLLSDHRLYSIFSKQSIIIAKRHDIYKSAKELEAVYELAIKNYRTKIVPSLAAV
jgi:glycosyltransferase involved in cell wall biosynthesis